MGTTQTPSPLPAAGASPPGGVLDAWREGVSTVQAMPSPLGFPPDRWRQVQQDAARLLDEHAAELHRAGWTAADVFGVHPTVPGVAVHCAGLAIVLGGGRVAEVTPEHVAFVRPSGARLTYARRSSPEAVPLWGLER